MPGRPGGESDSDSDEDYGFYEKPVFILKALFTILYYYSNCSPGY